MAGNGAGAYISDDGSYRSRNSWGVVYTDWLKEQGVHTNVTSLAYSGSTTDDILNLQVPKVPSSADVVMFTAGGNDVHFEKIVTQCFAIAVRDPRLCRALVDDASTQLGKVKQDTTKILAALDSKLPDDAQVLLVGYPLLSLDQDYQLAQCYASSPRHLQQVRDLRRRQGRQSRWQGRRGDAEATG